MDALSVVTGALTDVTLRGRTGQFPTEVFRSDIMGQHSRGLDQFGPGGEGHEAGSGTWRQPGVQSTHSRWACVTAVEESRTGEERRDHRAAVMVIQAFLAESPLSATQVSSVPLGPTRSSPFLVEIVQGH